MQVEATTHLMTCTPDDALHPQVPIYFFRQPERLNPAQLPFKLIRTRHVGTRGRLGFVRLRVLVSVRRMLTPACVQIPPDCSSCQWTKPQATTAGSR